MTLEVGRTGLNGSLGQVRNPSGETRNPRTDVGKTPAAGDVLEISAPRVLGPGFRPELAFENPETLANALSNENQASGLERTADVLVLAAVEQPEVQVEEQSEEEEQDVEAVAAESDSPAPEPAAVADEPVQRGETRERDQVRAQALDIYSQSAPTETEPRQAAAPERPPVDLIG